MNTETESGHELIRMKGVEKCYEGQLIVRIDELVLRQGDRVGVVGANGSGKSTLLRILGGISVVDRGEVHWAEELRAGSLGYVPQSGGMYGELTVQDNLELWLRLSGMSPDDGTGRLVDRFGLGPLREKRFAELSGGYQRLAVMASALQLEPTWLLLDEPFAGVDEAKAQQIIRSLEPLPTGVQLLVMTGQSSDPFPGTNRFLEVRDGQVRERTEPSS